MVDDVVLFKGDFSVELFSLYYKKGKLYPILENYGGTTLIWNTVGKSYYRIPKSYYYSVEQTRIFIERLMKNIIYKLLTQYHHKNIRIAHTNIDLNRSINDNNELSAIH